MTLAKTRRRWLVNQSAGGVLSDDGGRYDNMLMKRLLVLGSDLSSLFICSLGVESVG